MEETAKTGIFEERPGVQSQMRLMSFIAFLMGCLVALITLLKPGVESSTGLYLTGCFLIAGFFPKALQKFAEARFPK